MLISALPSINIFAGLISSTFLILVSRSPYLAIFLVRKSVFILLTLKSFVFFLLHVFLKEMIEVEGGEIVLR